jgi:hypothetical protein
VRKAPNRLFNVMEWLEFNEVVRADNKLACGSPSDSCCSAS